MTIPVRIVLLPGDGVGPEVTAAAQAVLEAVGVKFGIGFAFETHLVGGAAIDAVSDPLPPETLEACRGADAIFLGAVGGPKWGTGTIRPEQGLLGLREGLGLYANLRPVAVHEALADKSPLRREKVLGVDLLIVRELTGGLYFGQRRRGPDYASDLCVYTVAEVERVARTGFRAAKARRGRVTSIDKANVLETSRLWRDVVIRIGRDEFPEVELEHALVDSAAMRLVLDPKSFDVLLTENLFGDILSDEASVLAGSIGVLGSASLGEKAPGLFEPIHGSAPDIAGRDIANPLGAIAAAAMLLRDGLNRADAADAVDRAAAATLSAGVFTPDLGGTAKGSDVTTAVVARL